MRYVIPFILSIFFTLEIKAQEKQFAGFQLPVFRNKSDSVEYAKLDAQLMKVSLATDKASTMDSLWKVRTEFLKTKKHVMRTFVRQNPSYTKYQDLSKITNKDSITRISIVGNDMRKLPERLSEYKNLSSLELIGFRLNKIPKDIAVSRLTIYSNRGSRHLKLPRNNTITQLIIRGDERGKLPKKFRQLEKLSSLQLSWNQKMTKFPNVKGCDSLKTLDLNNNNISKISASVVKLPKLENFSLYNNRIKELPDFLFAMQSLRIIDFHYNEITTLSPKIGQLKNLEVIYMANNKLSSLPDEIGSLTNLAHLYIHHNRLQKLPVSIKNLSSLYTLRVNHNELMEWPEGVAYLKNLGNLDCSWNQLKTTPITSLDLPGLKQVDLSGNPFDPRLKQELEIWAEKLREKEVVVILNGLTLN